MPAQADHPAIHRSKRRPIGPKQRAFDILLVALLYATTAHIGQAWAIPPGNVTPVWIPSGIVLAAVLLRGYHVWPGIFLGAFIGNVWPYVDPQVPATWIASGISGTANGIGDTLGTITGAWLLHKRTKTLDPFEQTSHIGAFLSFGVVLASIVSALFGVTALCLVGFVEPSAWVYTTTTWFVGDSVGVLIIAPMVVTWSSPHRRRAGHPVTVGSFAVLTLATSTYCLDLLRLEPPLQLPLFVLTPLFLVSVFCFDRRTTFTTIVAVSAMSIAATATGRGPFTSNDLNDSLIELQLFLAVMGITVLYLHAAVEERWQSKDQLQALNQQLERRVTERTEDLRNELVARERAELERQQLERKLQHTQKLESLGVLAGGIAHDFNNLLVAIMGNADLALEDLLPDHPARESLDDIITASRRASELAGHMLAYSGKGSFIVAPSDLNAIVMDMAEFLRVSTSKKAELIYELGEDLLAVEVDATQMRQLIMNLVINASEALEDKPGTITIRTRVAHFDDHTLQQAYVGDHLATGEYLIIGVEDTGSGMDEWTRERMFDPFFTTKFTGRGLGMAATLGIVRGHKAAIRVMSEVGRGTSIEVLLPVTHHASPPMHPLQPDEAGAPLRPSTILIVDDERSVLETMKKMLERDGHTIMLASDGREAVDVFAQRRDDIDCVVLDLTMPIMDGEETYQELERLKPGVNVVLASGFDEQDSIDRKALSGVAGFIRKPFQSAELRSVVSSALRASGGK